MLQFNFVVLGAMADELKFIQELIAHQRVRHSVRSCLLTGVGKIQAALGAQEAIAHGATHLIVVGTCGGIGDGVAPGSVILADRTTFHDVDATPLGFAPGEIPFTGQREWASDGWLNDRLLQACSELGLTPVVGGLLSGDRFIADAAEASRLAEATNCIGVDWETAAIAFTARRAGIPWAAVRVVSDKADAEAISEFGSNIRSSAEKLGRIIERLDGQLGLRETGS